MEYVSTCLRLKPLTERRGFICFFVSLPSSLCVSVGGREWDFMFYLCVLLAGDNPLTLPPSLSKMEDRHVSAEHAEASNAEEQERR